jgi:hypothetical protein
LRSRLQRSISPTHQPFGLRHRTSPRRPWRRYMTRNAFIFRGRAFACVRANEMISRPD